MPNELPNNLFETCIRPLAETVAATYCRDTLHIKVCAMEEMSELIKEIAKGIRYRDRKSEDQMAEEIGHVVLMVFALMYDLGIDIQEVIEPMRNAVGRMLIVNQNKEKNAYASFRRFEANV